MKRTAEIIWQLPQIILGYIVSKATKSSYLFKHHEANVYSWKLSGGMSLGKYIFVPINVDDNYIKHEYGHTVQSKYLGWFYLIIIGLPSLIWNTCFREYRKKHNISYYAFYTEKSADKLGGVNRYDSNG